MAVALATLSISMPYVVYLVQTYIRASNNTQINILHTVTHSWIIHKQAVPFYVWIIKYNSSKVSVIEGCYGGDEPKYILYAVQ